MTQLGITLKVSLPYEKALNRAIQVLKEEGFGVLTKIDVQKTMQEKLGAAFRKYTILGMCNPPLAYQALTLKPEIGLLLPCNVVVYEEEDGTVINIFDPLSMFAVMQDSQLEPIAQEAHGRLKRAAEALQTME